MYDDVGLLHEVGHVVEEALIRLEVSLLHQPAVPEHPREDAVLIDRAILHTAAAAPNDLLLLLEALHKILIHLILS